VHRIVRDLHGVIRAVCLVVLEVYQIDCEAYQITCEVQRIIREENGPFMRCRGSSVSFTRVSEMHQIVH